MAPTDPQPGENLGSERGLTVEDFLAWWLDELRGAKGEHGRFLQLVTLGFVVVRIVQNPQPLLDALDELNDALTESLLAAVGDDVAAEPVEE